MSPDDDVTERPLSAGRMAQLHLGSFATEFDFSAEHFARIQPDFDRLVDCVHNPKRSSRRLRPVADVYAVRAHEQDHLNRLLGTSFGFLLETVRSKWVIETGRLVEKVSARSALSLPLGVFPPPAPGSLSDMLGELGRRRKGIDRQRAICRGLSNALLALLDAVSGPELVSALWGLSGGNEEKVRFLLGGEPPHTSGFTVLSPDGQPLTLGTRHLLELFGWREQGNAMLTLGYDLKDAERLMVDGGNEYQLAFEFWRAVVPAARRLVRVVNGVEQITWGKSFPFELFVLADLALWPPFEPPGRLAPGYRWYDINPPRRFATALAAFVELKLPLTRTRDDRLDERVRTLQAAVCDRLNWPTPEALAGKWLGELGRHLAADTTPWAGLETEHPLRVPGAVALLRERLARPADVILNHVHLVELGARSSAVWVFRQPDGGKRFGVMAEPGHRHLFQALFYEGAAHLYAGKRSLVRGVREPHMRSLIARVVAQTYRKLFDWPAGEYDRLHARCTAFFAGPSS